MPLETEIPWTYTRNPGPDTKQQRRDDVRFKTGDTEENDPLFSDGEVDALLTAAGDDTLTAAISGCRRLMARWSRHVPVTQGGVSVGGSRTDQVKTALKELIREKNNAAGGGFFSGGRSKAAKRAFRDDTDAVQPNFAIGMDDNSAASSRVFDQDDVGVD